MALLGIHIYTAKAAVCLKLQDCLGVLSLGVRAGQEVKAYSPQIQPSTSAQGVQGKRPQLLTSRLGNLELRVFPGEVKLQLHIPLHPPVSCSGCALLLATLSSPSRSPSSWPFLSPTPKYMPLKSCLRVCLGGRMEGRPN